MPTRRAVPVRPIARGLALAALSIASGCRWLPARRPSADLDPRTASRPVGPEAGTSDEAAPIPFPIAESNSVPLPTLPLRPISDDEALGRSAPTPILDAALARAGGIETEIAEEIAAPPEPRPEPAPPIPLPEGPTRESTQMSIQPAVEVATDPAPIAFGLPPAPLPPVILIEDEPDPAVADPSARDQPEAAEPTAMADVPADSSEVGTSEPDAPESTPTPTPTGVPTPEFTWRSGLDRLSVLAREQSGTPGPAAPGLWDVRARVLGSLQVAESSGPTDGKQTLWDTTLGAIAVGERTGSGVESTETGAMPDRSGGLAIDHLVFCRTVGGFGIYEPASPDSIAPGRELTLYWEVRGLEVDRSEGRFRTRVASTVELLDPKSGRPVWSQSFPIGEDDSRSPRRDNFINASFQVPKSLPPGRYRLRLTLNDLIAGESANSEIDVVFAALY